MNQSFRNNKKERETGLEPAASGSHMQKNRSLSTLYPLF